MRDDRDPRITLQPMSRSHPQPHLQDSLTAYYWSGDAIRSRRVSDVVLSGTVDIPEPPARLTADWAREISHHMNLEVGDVEVMPLARARVRWPDYSRCVRAVSDWASTLGLPEVLAASDVALMVCRGARYHHDGDQYGGAAFCNLFLSEDKGQDVHFPLLDLRIPLQRGSVLIFDTCQPHAVIPRGSSRFSAADFPANQDCTQLFLTWELPIENAHVARALKIAFESDGSTARDLDEEQVRLHCERVGVCQETGAWQRYVAE